jgi:hypothetical protein
MCGKVHNWPGVIWREWRNCGDYELRRVLYDLAIDLPSSRLATLLTLLLLVTFYSVWIAVGTILPALMSATGPRTPESVWNVLREQREFLVYAIPALAMGAVVWRLWVGDTLTWRAWLLWLLPSQTAGLFSSLRGKRAESIRAAVMCCALLGGGAGVVARVLAQPFGATTSSWLNSTLTGLLVGFLAGRYTGPIYAPLVHLGALVPAAFGFAVTVYLDPVGRYFHWEVVDQTLLLSTYIFFPAWLGAGTVLGVVWRMDTSRKRIGSRSLGAVGQPYARSRRRPHPRCVEDALRIAVAARRYQGAPAREVTSLLKELARRRREAHDISQLITSLSSSRWQDRFIALRLLVDIGGEAAYRIASGRRSGSRLDLVYRDWLLRCVCADTQLQLKSCFQQRICPVHLVQCQRHRVSVSLAGRRSYIGCRHCGKSTDLLAAPRGVVAVIDRRMRLERDERDGYQRVNWLHRHGIFDFQHVEIVDAEDEDVERFVIQVENGMDRFQRRHLPGASVIVGGKELSTNTHRLLRRLFGDHVRVAGGLAANDIVPAGAP